MPLRFHPEARAELGTAVEWYERQQLGLGASLSVEVFSALELIDEAPGTWPAWPGVHHAPPIRRFLLTGFPFALPYLVLDELVVVLAVAHLRRRPGYWLERARHLNPFLD